jgi:hypothetical protein
LELLHPSDKITKVDRNVGLNVSATAVDAGLASDKTMAILLLHDGKNEATGFEVPAVAQQCSLSSLSSQLICNLLAVERRCICKLVHEGTRV